MVSEVNSPALKAALTASWLWKTRAGASITWRSGATAETLITAAPKVAGQLLQPALSPRRASAAGRTILSFRLSLAPSRQARRPAVSIGSCR